VAEFILETAAKGGKRKDGKRLNWNDEWLNSENAKEVKQEIQRIKSERSKVEARSAGDQHEFASPVALQTMELTKRLFIQYWRDPAYLYGKLFVSVIVGIFNGFTFWKLGNSVADMQDRMFTCFLIILIPPTIVNAVVPKFYQNRALWEARELPSRIYGWVAFCTANVVAEIPIAILGATIYWALWYWPTGLPTDSSTSGYVFLMTMLFVRPHQTSRLNAANETEFVPSKLGTMDLCLRSLLHSHLERPPLLLRHVLALQRCGPSLCPAFRLLAVLALLPQSLNILDRRRLGSHPRQHARPLRPARSSILQSTSRLNLLLLRPRLRQRCHRISY